MQIEIKAREDENFKIIKDEKVEEIIDDSHTSSVNKTSEKRQPTLDNPKGHEWFNGTSWGLK